MNTSNYPLGYQTAKEAIVREIRDAKRWSAISEAIYALHTNIRIGNQMKEEQDKLHPSTTRAFSKSEI